MILMQMLLDGRDADLASGVLPPPLDGALNGTSVWLTGDSGTVPLKLAIGAPGYSDGAVHIYQRTAVLYSYQTTILSPLSNIDFGRAVAMSDDGTRLIVGAPDGQNIAETANTGRIYAYKWNGETYLADGVLDADAGGLGPGIDGRLGQVLSVAKDGNSFVAGAPGASGNTGFAYGWSYSTQWDALGQRMESIQGGSNNSFANGVSLSADGLQLITCKPGAARFQFWSRISNTASFNEIANFSSNSGAQSVSFLSPDLAFIAGQFGVESYQETSPGVWAFSDNEVKPPNSGANFGTSVAAAGGRLIVGAPGDNIQGAVFGGTITAYSFGPLGVMTFLSNEQAPIIGGESTAEFGASVAIFDPGVTTTAVGEPNRDRLGLIDVGNVYTIEGL